MVKTISVSRGFFIHSSNLSSKPDLILNFTFADPDISIKDPFFSIVNLCGWGFVPGLELKDVERENPVSSGLLSSVIFILFKPVNYFFKFLLEL